MVLLQQLAIAALPNSRIIFVRLRVRARIIHYEKMAADPAAALNATAELRGPDASGAEILPIGDDRGCGKPYSDKIKAAISG